MEKWGTNKKSQLNLVERGPRVLKFVKLFHQQGQTGNLSQTVNHLRRWDLTGLSLSALCLIHCLGAPLAMASLPALAMTTSESLIHWLLAFVLLAVAGWAFYRGYRVHGQKKVPFWGSLGLALLFLALFAPEHSHLLGHSHGVLTWETGFSVLGSLILVSAHLQNMKLCRHSCCCPSTSLASGAKSDLRPGVCGPTDPSTQSLRSPQLG